MKNLMYAMNVELKGGEAPEWVQLLPAGPSIVGRDGREWNCGPEEVLTVLNNFESDPIDLVIDREHASELKAPKGDEAPAAAWIVELADRHGDGAVWAHVDWTPRGRNQVENREYRYLSPVFSYTRDGRNIQALVSAGLTNQPNLHLTALNRQGTTMEDDTMKKALCRLLGLPETATEQEIQDAVSKLQGDLETAGNRATSFSPLLSELGLKDDARIDDAVVQIKALNSKVTDIDLTKYVLRGDYDVAINRAEKAEGELETLKESDLEEKIETAVNSAISGGKIAPANKDFYISMCRKDGGLEEFQKFAESAPQVITDPQLPDTPKDGNGSLTDGQKAMCRNLGISEEEYAKSLKEED